MDEMQAQMLILQVQQQTQQIIELKRLVLEGQQNFIPEFCTLKKACELKGMNQESLYSQKWQQPCCGTKWIKLNGRRVWSREDIVRWLSVTDETLEEYAKEIGVNISRYFRGGRNVGCK